MSLFLCTYIISYNCHIVCICHIFVKEKFNRSQQFKPHAMQTKVILSVWFSFLMLFFVASCVKEGPQGPPGTSGTNGTNGTNGVDGLDGAEKCSACHASNTDLYAKQLQFSNSIHRIGGNFERNATSCAVCHTHEGFIERLETGA
jgi:hypothetical protein